MSVPFSELELSDPLRRAVEEMGFTEATEIQAQTIPLLREGKDVIGRSQTGTGKTLAFGIPAVEIVDTVEEKNNVQVLILCPTRELSMQACDEIRKLAKYRAGVKTADIYGGAPMNRQIMMLRGGTNIVVGTPGRILDHLSRRTLKLNALKMVVLDEADEMLSMGFKEDIETILSSAPAERQTVLFSATMPPAILALTGEFQRDPQLVEIDRKQPSVKAIHQCYYDVPASRKMDALSLILYAKDPNLCIIFCNTKKMTEELSEHLKKQGFRAEGLNGDMKQAQRTQVMNAFKAGSIQILVATDVAARGIDVNDIDYVINYDIPQDIEYYIHRIGRTGRAGKTGNALTLCSGRRQEQVLFQIARIVRSQITRESLPTPRDIQDQIQKRQMEQIENLLAATRPAAANEASEAPETAPPQEKPLGRMKMVEELKSRGYEPEAIAAAALTLLYPDQPLRISEIHAPKERRSRTDDAATMGKISLSVGRANRITPNHIVGAIAEMTQLRGGEIGKIEIYDNKTVVGIPLTSVRHVVDRMRNCKICGQTAQADEYHEVSGERRPRAAGFKSEFGERRFAAPFPARSGGPRDSRRHISKPPFRKKRDDWED